LYRSRLNQKAAVRASFRAEIAFAEMRWVAPTNGTVRGRSDGA
jgi:hypothetical protein